MKQKIIFGAFTALVLAGCSSNEQAEQTAVQPVQVECQQDDGLLGGWSFTQVSPEVEKALDVVLKQMDSSAKLEKILSVKSQIVAGVNYAIDFEMDNGELWNAVVYQDLDDNYIVTQKAAQGSVNGSCL